MDKPEFKSRFSVSYGPFNPMRADTAKTPDPTRWRGWVAIVISIFALFVSGLNALPGWLNRADKLSGTAERLQALMPFENSRAFEVALTDEIGRPFPIHDREFMPGVKEETKPEFRKTNAPDFVGQYQIGPIAVTTILSNPTDLPLTVVDVDLRQVAIGRPQPRVVPAEREFINRDVQLDPLPPFTIPAHGATRLSIYTYLRLNITRDLFIKCKIYHDIDQLVFCLTGKEDDQPEIMLGEKIATIPSELTLSTAAGKIYFIGLNGFNIPYEELKLHQGSR